MQRIDSSFCPILYRFSVRAPRYILFSRKTLAQSWSLPGSRAFVVDSKSRDARQAGLLDEAGSPESEAVASSCGQNYLDFAASH